VLKIDIKIDYKFKILNSICQENLSRPNFTAHHFFIKIYFIRNGYRIKLLLLNWYNIIFKKGIGNKLISELLMVYGTKLGSDKFKTYRGSSRR
jgi:hypothetical protein